MLIRTEREEGGKIIGKTFFETGKGEIEISDMTVRFEARFEMEKADDGSFVSCGFDRFEKIEVIPGADVAREVPYAHLGWLDGWLLMQWTDEAMAEAEEDAERRANQKDL